MYLKPSRLVNLVLVSQSKIVKNASTTIMTVFLCADRPRSRAVLHAIDDCVFDEQHSWRTSLSRGYYCRRAVHHAFAPLGFLRRARAYRAAWRQSSASLVVAAQMATIDFINTDEISRSSKLSISDDIACAELLRTPSSMSLAVGRPEHIISKSFLR